MLRDADQFQSHRFAMLKNNCRPSMVWFGWLLITGLVPVAMCGNSIAANKPSAFSGEERGYWAFQPVRRIPPPAVPSRSLVRNPIDRFLLKRLQTDGLEFSREADKYALLRRAKYDLLGLPPTSEEIEQFLSDDSVDAYEKLIDRLLASPHYGETWGRIWLDLVRFAETAGFNADPDRPLAYKYRRYVIHAFNNDLPYDQFIREQLAGDELYPDDPNAWIATGFNRMWPDESNASNVELARQDALNDLTSNVGNVFLGLSIGCAQCHDHKFDPILQKDFYQLQAYFSGIVPFDRVPVAGQSEYVRFQRRQADWLNRTAAVRHELHDIEHAARKAASAIKRLKFPDIVLDAIDTPEEERTAFQHQLAFWSERQIVVTPADLAKKLSSKQQKRLAELKEEYHQLRKSEPQPPRQLQAMAVAEVPTGPVPVSLLAGGSYNKPVELLEPAVLSVIDTSLVTPPTISATRSGTSGRRSALAAWLTDPRHPLTARVMVNRIWQGHFGKGLVENANDFGNQTRPPSHPELLDWLAIQFVERGWSVKAMHRLIMTSHAYRQQTYRPTSAQPEHPAMAADAGNQRYWHYPRRRLSAEAIRDSMLSVSGALNAQMHAAAQREGVRPELPPNYSAREKWTVDDEADERNRRSVYIYAKRNLPYPMLHVFDLPDMHESCARRAETTVAPQALMVLNSELIIRYAESFAARLTAIQPGNVPSELNHSNLRPRIEAAYLLAFGRPADTVEIDDAIEFIKAQQALISSQSNPPSKAASQQALVDFCHALFNANEFIYLD